MGLGIFYFSTKGKKIFTGKNEEVQAPVEKREFQIHFIKKGEKQSIAYGMKLKIQYDLYLVDRNRPDLKGKLVESRKYIGDKKGQVLTQGAYLPGIEHALLQMTEDSEAWVFIPWEEGYGEKSVGDGLVPDKQDLVAIIKVH